jgi:hypothetical protein
VPGTQTESAFLALLRIYLQPRQPTEGADLLRPALELVSRHGPRLDPAAALELLPPLVPTRDLRAFLMDALRAPRLDARAVREIARARQEDVGRGLMALQSRRVKVTDSRT